MVAYYFSLSAIIRPTSRFISYFDLNGKWTSIYIALFKTLANLAFQAPFMHSCRYLSCHGGIGPACALVAFPGRPIGLQVGIKLQPTS